MATTHFRFNIINMAAMMVCISISVIIILMIPGTTSTSHIHPPSQDTFFKYYFVAHTDGTFQKLLPPNHVPASLDKATQVQSTDVVINHKTKVVARLYRPMKLAAAHSAGTRRLPVIVYFHAGGFAISSALDKDVHTYMNKLSSSGNVVILSVDYRLVPDTPVADIYKDGFDAVKWLSEHAKGKGDLEWMKEVVDFDRIFVGGHDAGGNMAHNVGMKFQKAKPKGVRLAGIIPIQSYFLTVDPMPSLTSQDKDMMYNITKYWPFIVPGSSSKDPRVNPSLEPDLKILKPAKVLVCVAELDGLRDASKAYYDALKKSGVEAEYYVSKGKHHNFDNFKTDSDEATALQSKIFSFVSN